MGKITDAIIAVLVLIVGLFILTKLGITWPGIWKMIHTFFSSSSPTTNGTASSILIGMAASNSKVRDKIKKRKEQFIRLSKIREIKGIINRRVNRRA
jgi:hypothetical protein